MSGPFEDVMPKEAQPAEYLGDGVYASFDGYQIWLAVNDHRSPPVVAIEPRVYEALRQYAERIWPPRNGKAPDPDESEACRERNES